MNKSFAPLCAALFLAMFFSCRPQPEVSAGSGALPQNTPVYADALGRTYAKQDKPSRIVSLSPAVTEILFAIGAGDLVVGVTQYCNYPPAAAEKTSVGGFSGATMSIELIRVLKPDLVILSADMHSRIVSLLDELGIPSFAVEPRNFSQVYDTIAVIGEISGCSAGAEDVIAGMKEKIAGVKERTREREKPGVFWILSEDPLMTAGRGTFISEAISLAGGTNIFDDIQEQWPLVSPEQVILRKPEWILRESSFPSESSLPTKAPPQLGNLLLSGIPAVREGRIGSINADLLYRYGPRLADGVYAVAKILHPEM